MYNIYFKYEDVPKVLPGDIQEELLKKMVTGDKVARNKLINHNVRLVIYEINHKFINVWLDKDDLISIGIYGLIKGIDTFDISKGVKFVTYAIHCIDNENLMFIRKQKCYLKHTVDNVNFSMIPDYNNDIATEYEEKEERELVVKLLSCLSKREQYVVKLYFGFFNERCYTQTEIAKILDLDQSSVSRIISKSLKTIKCFMNSTNLNVTREGISKVKVISR